MQNTITFSFSEIGVGLAGFGISFLFLGVLLLFDKGLLAIGNVWQTIPACLPPVFNRSYLTQILFICGLACVIGIERTFRFFFQKHKVKASIAFFGGITVVLFGYPMIGMIFETYGFFLLFRYDIRFLSSRVCG